MSIRVLKKKWHFNMSQIENFCIFAEENSTKSFFLTIK